MKFPTSAVPVAFGYALARRRLARGWTQAKLAEQAGLARETVARLEADRRPPVADTVFRLEAALDLLPGELVPAWPEWAPLGLATWGARSRERRRALGLPLAGVALAVGVSVATLSRFEREVGRSSTLLEAVPAPPGAEPWWRPVEPLALALRFPDRASFVSYCMEP